MIVKLLTEHHLEFLSLKGGYRGSSKLTHVKMPHCWKSHALAHIKKLKRHVSSECQLVYSGGYLYTMELGIKHFQGSAAVQW